MPLPDTTNNLGFVQLVTSQANKEVTINNQAGEFDASVTQLGTADLTSGSYTAVLADFQRAIIWKVTNCTTTGRTVTFPASPRAFAVRSDAGNTNTFNVVVGSTQISLAPGTAAWFYADGTANGLIQIGSGGGGAGGDVSLTAVNQSFTGGVLTPAVIADGGGGTLGSFTVNPGLGPIQKGTINSAITITAPANDGGCDIFITNGASAAAPTFSGFTVGSNTGSPYTTGSGNKFVLTIKRGNGIATYSWYALQ
jgi:hypothetical protein